jgi:hypothetical protein
MWRWRPLAFLPSSWSRGPPLSVGFHTLVIDHASAGRGFATHRFARDHEQRMIDRESQPVGAPQGEPMPHGRDWRKARRWHSPRQTAAQEVQDCLYDSPQRLVSGTPNHGRRRKKWRTRCPLRIGHIARQDQAGSRMLCVSGIGTHRSSKAVFSLTAESMTDKAVKLTN